MILGDLEAHRGINGPFLVTVPKSTLSASDARALG